MSDAAQAAFIGAIVGAAVSALGALITTVINNRYADNRRKANDRKWYAEHFLSRKIESVSTLYSSLVHAEAAINKYDLLLPGAYTPAEYVKNVKEVVDRFDMNLALAWVYLEEDDRSIQLDFSSELDMASGELLMKIIKKDEDSSDLSLDKFDDLYDSAVENLQAMLSPDVLKGIEPEK